MTEIILLGLQLLLGFLTWVKQTQQIEVGKDQEIAKAAAAILIETNAAKQIMQQITGMTDAQVDDALKALEP